MSRGVVLVRSPDPGLQLQALRTALSLSLGDRPADVLVAATAARVLAQPDGSETDHCLKTLRQLPTGLHLDQPVTGRPSDPPLSDVLEHREFVERLASADFLLVF